MKEVQCRGVLLFGFWRLHRNLLYLTCACSRSAGVEGEMFFVGEELREEWRTNVQRERTTGPMKPPMERVTLPAKGSLPITGISYP